MPRIKQLGRAGWILGLLLTSACISTSPGAWKFVPKDVSEHPATPYRLGEVSVSAAGLDFRTSSEQAALKKALTKALRLSNVFDANGEQAANLHATVLDFSQPPMSLGGFTSTLRVRYTLTSASGETLFDEELDSGGVDDTGSSLGPVRAGRARTMAVANSVHDFRSDVEPALLAHSRREFPQYLAMRSGGAPTPMTPPAARPATPPAPIQEALVDPLGSIQGKPPADLSSGRYYALVIGNNAYGELPKLRTARNDARAVSKLLREGYDFDVTLLEDVGRSAILRSLTELRRRTTDADSLLIYYAGHGYFDEGTRRGYWLPVDANGDEPSNWISTADVSDMLRAMPARHVMVVADSCYSGALTRGIKIRNRDQAYLNKMAAKRSRVVLTSGGIEPVEDGSGSHSIFAKAFLDALEGNDHIIEGVGVFSAVRRPVMLGADQEPEFGDIRSTGHEDGGDFIFIRKRD